MYRECVWSEIESARAKNFTNMLPWSQWTLCVEGLPRGAGFFKYTLRTYQAHDWLELCLERTHPTIKGDQRARETKKSACKTPTFRSISSAPARRAHRGRLREETACTWRPHRRRSASGFLHVGEKVGELINWWGSGREGKSHLYG